MSLDIIGILTYPSFFYFLQTYLSFNALEQLDPWKPKPV
jgi:hypothetical protein